MKHSILVLVLVAFATLGFAQDRGERPQMQQHNPEEMMKKVTKDLGLSEEQQVQWKAIHEKYGKPSGDRERDMEVRKEMGKELEAILTDEQKKKFDEMRKNHKPPGQRR